jgi:hypothetical protein
MNDFDRDPELHHIRELWVPPSPPEGLEEQVLRAFRQSQPRAPRRRYWLFAAAAGDSQRCDRDARNFARPRDETAPEITAKFTDDQKRGE